MVGATVWGRIRIQWKKAWATAKCRTSRKPVQCPFPLESSKRAAKVGGGQWSLTGPPIPDNRSCGELQLNRGVSHRTEKLKLGRPTKRLHAGRGTGKKSETEREILPSPPSCASPGMLTRKQERKRNRVGTHRHIHLGERQP